MPRTPKSQYQLSQLEKLLPVDQYGVRIKLVSASGGTKWMRLDVSLARQVTQLARAIRVS